MDVKSMIKDSIEKSRKLSFAQPAEAFDIAKEALFIARENHLVEDEAYALFAMALACRSMTKLNDCYNYGYDSYKLFQSLDNSFGMATALNILGIVYFYHAAYEQALQYFLKAERLLGNNHDQITLVRVYNNMGELYREVGNYDQALAVYESALQICQNENYVDTLAVILDNIGEVYFRKQEYGRSFEFFNQSLEILEKGNNVTTIAETLNRIGRIYYVWHDNDKARKNYLKALQMLEDIDNRFFVIDVLINLAELEMANDEKVALRYLRKAVKYGEELNARKKLSDIYKMLTEFYENKSDFETSLSFYKRYHLIEQEISASIVSNKLEIIKLELGKLFQGEEIEKVKRLNSQLAKEIENNKTLLDSMEKTNRNLSMEIMLDELTGIPNRRGIKTYLHHFWNDQSQKPFQAALYMLDIDYFKRFNDYHGHVEGDICLKAIADCLKKVLENWIGLIGRFGGEEFVGFIRDIDYATANIAAEQIRQAVEDLGITYRWNETNYPITVSIGGIWGINTGFKDFSDMVRLADKKLFDAKNAGRNCVCMEAQFDANYYKL